MHNAPLPVGWNWFRHGITQEQGSSPRSCDQRPTRVTLSAPSLPLHHRSLQGEDIASSRNFILDTTPPQLAFLPDSLASGSATPAAVANISWEGSDATGVAYTCTLQGSGTVPLQPPVYSGSTKLEMQQAGWMQLATAALPVLGGCTLHLRDSGQR